jgi:hypothetical protein
MLGRMARRLLAAPTVDSPGRHRSSFVATAGGVSSKASVLRLRIVR